MALDIKLFWILITEVMIILFVVWMAILGALKSEVIEGWQRYYTQYPIWLWVKALYP